MRIVKWQKQIDRPFYLLLVIDDTIRATCACQLTSYLYRQLNKQCVWIQRLPLHAYSGVLGVRSGIKMIRRILIKKNIYMGRNDSELDGPRNE